MAYAFTHMVGLDEKFYPLEGEIHGKQIMVGLDVCATVDRYNQNVTKYPGAIALTKAAAMSALGRGYGIVHHIGHGAPSQLSIGNEIVTMSELSTLTNGDSMGLWIASNCSSAAVDYECVAEEVVRNPGGGAFAYLGDTREA